MLLVVMMLKIQGIGKCEAKKQKERGMDRRSLRIYVAGPIQGETVLQTLKNIDNGLKHTVNLFQLGFSPFPVFSDFQFIMRSRPVPKIEDVYAYSLAWLRVSDAVFCIDGWEKSKGVAQEISEAGKYKIPVFHDVTDLCAWAETKNAPLWKIIDEVLAKSDD
jgi:hypothetical protein